MAQEYTLNFTSRRIYLIRGFVAIIIGLLITLMIIISLKLNSHMLVFLGINALVTPLLFYLSKNWHKGQLLIRFSEREIYLSSYFPLFRHSKAYNFYWNELKDISFSDTQYFRIFVIRDQKKKVAFVMDYGDAVTHFEQKLNKQIAKLNQAESFTISQKPSVYETKSGMAIAVVLGLMMVAWPLVAWINQREFQIGLALIFYSGAGFFIYMVYRTRKKKVSE